MVMVHGLFGWGEKRPLGGLAPPYFPMEHLRSMWTGGSMVAVDVGVATSDHDTACEAFAQLKGLRIDYGEDHSTHCGHSRFGHDYQSCGLLRRWDAANPIHIIGHSFGGNTAVRLLTLLADDYWGLGTSSEWVLSITCICSPLRGCSLVYAVTGVTIEPGSTNLMIPKWSFAHWAAIILGIFLRAQCLFPSLHLKALYDMKCDQWGSLPLTWKGVVDIQHPFWQSGDNVVNVSDPVYSERSTLARLKRIRDTRLVAVVAESVEPLSPARALAACVPLACSAVAAVLALWRIRRRLKTLLRNICAKKPSATKALALFATFMSVSLFQFGSAERRNGLARTWATAIERLLPRLHRFFILPLLRLTAHSVQKASSTLYGSAALTSFCPAGQQHHNDGMIDISSQCGVGVPKAWCQQGKRNSMRMRCTRSAEYASLAAGPRAMLNSFSQADLANDFQEDVALETGRWHVLRIRGADHSLGTSLSAHSIDMYQSVLDLLGKTEHRRR